MNGLVKPGALFKRKIDTQNIGYHCTKKPYPDDAYNPIYTMLDGDTVYEYVSCKNDYWHFWIPAKSLYVTFGIWPAEFEQIY